LATSEKHEHLLKEGKVAADSKAKLLDDAERYVLHGKIPQAISAYLKIVNLDPNDVLILNTIGDLNLKLNAVAEANTCFSRVAENYVRNNFFLKAIAVYKKILQTDPNNIEINSIMATLYVKQGLSRDARIQFLRLAALLEQEGNIRDSLIAYEEVVELDPLNSDVQRKLAELYQAEGAEDKAQPHWVSAARAQVQAGDLKGAVNSFEHAVQLDPLDEDALSGLLEGCLKMGDPGPALDRLKKSMEMAPHNLNIGEMLGRAYLGSGDPKAALEYLEKNLKADPESQKYWKLHRQAFAEAYPDTPYIPPVEPPLSTVAVVAAVPLVMERDTVETTDLLDAFRSNDQQLTARKATESQPLPEVMPVVPDVVRGAPSQTAQEQLQEVDFYIQLGFHGEALEKLNEIAKANPNHPELASKYEKLGAAKTTAQQSTEDSDRPFSSQSSEGSTAEGLGSIHLIEFDNISDHSQDDLIGAIPDGKALESLCNTALSATEPSFSHTEPSQDSKPTPPADTSITMNDLFTDLLEEVSAIGRKEAKAAFEEHFSLGTAYREMDLIEEAIKEFEIALKAVDMQAGDPRVIQCCCMLSACLLKKNMPDLVLRWCQTGLGFADISSHEAMALRYDMGVAYSMAGSKDEALECFDRIFRVDPSYRDVAQRIDELRSGSERHAS
jgi:tetratricopeptide (TPR) repeat protein